MSRFEDVVQRGARGSQPAATAVPIGTLYGVSDEVGVIERSSGSAWQSYGAASHVIQVKNTQTGAVNTGTTTIPADDTIPQNTEGTEFMTLAITPTSATNKLRIDVFLNMATGTANRQITAALFQDTTANALAAAGIWQPVADASTLISFTHYMTSGTTSATTFKVRVGPDSAATVTFNGFAGARKYGGVLSSGITITEIVP